MIPYGRQLLDEDDVQAVVQALRSGWLTTGPLVEEFEQAVAARVGAAHAVAVSSGTAALHCAAYAIDIKPDDEVVVPPMTFAASANCVAFQGGTPVFADVEDTALLLDPAKAESALSKRTKAVIAVDYAGHPCDYDALSSLAKQKGLFFVADACHAIGATYKDRPVGSLADMTVFSFHPVKHITTGEGGMLVTDDPELAARARRFRNHCIDTDFRQREEQGSWLYEVTDLGMNYRLTDMQCALGTTQLAKLDRFLDRRRQLAAMYDKAFADMPLVNPLAVSPEAEHAYHLYVVRIDFPGLGLDRGRFMRGLREKGVGSNVHYIPVHLHPYYRRAYGYGPGLCPVAEDAYERIVSLPMHPGMSDEDLDTVVEAVRFCLAERP